jgi:hypothetical protein
MDARYKAAFFEPVTESYQDQANLDGTGPTAITSSTDAITAVYDFCADSRSGWPRCIWYGSVCRGMFLSGEKQENSGI